MIYTNECRCDFKSKKDLRMNNKTINKEIPDNNKKIIEIFADMYVSCNSRYYQNRYALILCLNP